jgi:ketosteroid isomerase-like protein
VFIAFRDHRIFEMLELLHKDVVWVRNGPDGKTEYHGHDGVRQMLSELEKATGGYSIHLDDVTEEGPRLVIAKGTVTAAGSHHGTDVTWKVQLLGGLVRGVETILPGLRVIAAVSALLRTS